MRAMTYRQYGPAENVQPADLPRPEAGKGEVLVKIAASSVTTADWRLRASAFPGGLWLMGRLMFGLFRPRQRILGGEFAGRVVACGEGVTEFATGDRVFGFAGHGTHAEYVTVKASGCITKTPEGLSDTEAAALPFGGLSALVFLRDFAQLRPGEDVLIPGASGGVGLYAVQVAKALGANVTAVASTSKLEKLRDLGADRVIDYTRQQMSAAGRDYDVILDPAGFLPYTEGRKLLKPNGRFVALNFGCAEIGQLIAQKLTGGPRLVIGVNGDKKEDLEVLLEMVKEGALRPVVGHNLPLEDIQEAYRLVESRRRKGPVILQVG